MTESTEEWELLEVRKPNESLLIRKKCDARPSAPTPDAHVIYLTFGCNNAPGKLGFYTEEDDDTFSQIDSSDIPSLERKTGAELVAVVSAWRVRDYIFYSSDPDSFLDKALYLRTNFKQFEIGCECGPDPTWSHYLELPTENKQ